MLELFSLETESSLKFAIRDRVHSVDEISAYAKRKTLFRIAVRVAAGSLNMTRLAAGAASSCDRGLIPSYTSIMH